MNLRRLGSCPRSNLRKTRTGALTWDHADRSAPEPSGCIIQVAKIARSLPSGMISVDEDRCSPPRTNHIVSDAAMHSRLPQRVDAVEKVPAMRSTRNNRIIVANLLNRSCAFQARFESILLGASPQNPFSTASVIFCRRAPSPVTAAYPKIAAVPGGCC